MLNLEVGRTYLVREGGGNEVLNLQMGQQLVYVGEAGENHRFDRLDFHSAGSGFVVLADHQVDALELEKLEDEKRFPLVDLPLEHTPELPARYAWPPRLEKQEEKG